VRPEPAAAVPAAAMGTGRAVATPRPRRRRWWSARIVGGGGVLCLLVLAAILAPVAAPHDPLRPDPAHALAGPSTRYLLGTDEFGRDLLSRLMYGARFSLLVSVASIALGAGVGAAGGLVAGYYGAAADVLVMRTADIVLAIPPVLLAIAVVAILGPGVGNLILTIGTIYAPRFTRVAYAAARAAQAREYVEAARALGASNGRILFRTILPASLTPLVVQAALAVGAAMLLESGLSFIGLGIRAPAPSWGLMVSSARELMLQDPLLVLWPAAALAIAVLAFNILGDGVRDLLDPRLAQGRTL
jgi:peptide/nickel transport system permease protein